LKNFNPPPLSKENSKSMPPAYQGLQLHVGASYWQIGDDYYFGGQLGIGYAILNDLRIVQNVAFQSRFLLFPSEGSPSVIIASFGFGVPLPSKISFLKAIPVEIGYAMAADVFFDNGGALLSVGLESRIVPLGFTHAGIAGQLIYSWIYLDKRIRGPTLRFTLL